MCGCVVVVLFFLINFLWYSVICLEWVFLTVSWSMYCICWHGNVFSLGHCPQCLKDSREAELRPRWFQSEGTSSLSFLLHNASERVWDNTVYRSLHFCQALDAENKEQRTLCRTTALSPKQYLLTAIYAEGKIMLLVCTHYMSQSNQFICLIKCKNNELILMRGSFRAIKSPFLLKAVLVKPGDRKMQQF